MEKQAVFTICAKNYLAQALTLKDSVLKHNKVDFFIVLADAVTDEINGVDIIELDKSWISEWQSMAYKYNVIEFSTSVKPFVFKKLFKEGYKNVIYLDPDTYVTDSLDYLWERLSKYSIILTPHYNNIQTHYTGAVTEEELLFVGIYNLGFAAISNSTIGGKIIDWWCNRLEEKCYVDHEDALHVDQRWMDFIPGFYPNDALICHHFGINVAIWNLHERELIIKNGKYVVIDLATQREFPLILFHFSGFDPSNQNYINRRHPRFGVKQFPSFKPIIEEYRSLEYKNEYNKFSKLTYSFNTYEDGTSILPLHRRLYREIIKESPDIKIGNPFTLQHPFYQILKHNHLIIKGFNKDFNLGIKKQVHGKYNKLDTILKKGALLFKSIVGLEKYYMFLRYISKFSRLENQYFLIKKGKTKKEL